MMGFSSQLHLLRSLLLRLHKLSKRKRCLKSRSSSSSSTVGCVGRIRSLNIPTLSSLRSWREDPPEANGILSRRKRRKKKTMKSFMPGLEDEIFVNAVGIPSQEEEFDRFTTVHPGYMETLIVDDLREEEYGELQEEGHVCLDYSGYGLFSQLQQELDSSSSTFAISYISGDLSIQASYGNSEEGTIEFDIRRRIMRFLNIQEAEYSMVFTASRGAAFKLLAESYPFSAQRNVLTMFDYDSEAVTWMEEAARKQGAQVLSASFNFPSLSVAAAELKLQLVHGTCKEKKGQKLFEGFDRKKDSKKVEKEEHRMKDKHKGLFVFPVQSRITGSKYSYQWMSVAQENGWHVLLDASALGPKDMDSLGLSLFRPDFIVTSFYKVFGSDPTGFGCLFIKNSSMGILRQSSAARGTGMVRLIPLPSESSPSSLSEVPIQDEEQASLGSRRLEDEIVPEVCNRKVKPGPPELACSGPVLSFYRRRQSRRYSAQGIDECPIANTRDDFNEPSLSLSSMMSDTQELSDGGKEEGKNEFEILGTPHSVLMKGSFNSMSRTLPWAYSLELGRDVGIAQSAQTFSMPLTFPGIEQDSSFAHSEVSSFYGGGQALDFSSSLYNDEEDEDESSEFDTEDDMSVVRKEPEIFCRGLNHADALGLNKTNDRLRLLINWLVSSLLKLQHLFSNKSVPLVHIYGPKVKYDRGAALAFNLFDRDGVLIRPVLVQQLADRNNISLGTGALFHINFPENCPDLQDAFQSEHQKSSDSMAAKSWACESGTIPRLRVVTASLGFFTNFEDVYRLWAFVAKFLDADFIKNESFCYRTLNQEQVVLELQNLGLW